MNGCTNLVKPDQGTDALLHERYILHRAGKIKFKNGNIKNKNREDKRERKLRSKVREFN